MASDIKESAEKFLHLMDRLRQVGPQTAPPKAANISPSQLAFIIFIASNPGCGILAIATGLKLSKPTVSIGVSQLEEAGFLSRQSDPQDGRAVQLFLTRKGQQLHDRTHEFRCRKFVRLLSGLGPQERATLLTLLEKSVLGIENQSDGEDNEQVSQ
jgi:DNA-binding MarR family transcriptional regulator